MKKNYTIKRTGYGHWTIICDLGNGKTRSVLTTDASWIDKYNSLRSDGVSRKTLQLSIARRFWKLMH